MKIIKKIFSIFNLCLFLGTLCFSSIASFAATPSQAPADAVHKQLHAKADMDHNSCSDLYIEKNENENEGESKNSMSVPALLLPFLASYFQPDLSSSSYSATQPLAVKCTSPIYLSVRNFRI